ncbi:MAG: hypothetical protein QOE49_3948 [Rhodospirillaceae bacterium]|nr:hypothetical protein [Rhodospirillaceae bacterium]
MGERRPTRGVSWRVRQPLRLGRVTGDGGGFAELVVGDRADFERLAEKLYEKSARPSEEDEAGS